MALGKMRCERSHFWNGFDIGKEQVGRCVEVCSASLLRAKPLPIETIFSWGGKKWGMGKQKCDDILRYLIICEQRVWYGTFGSATSISAVCL